MKGTLKLSIMLFTLFVCCLFVFYNPTIAAQCDDVIADGEVFFPHDGEFDFRIIKVNSTADNFTAKKITNGHTQLYCGDITINILEYDKMIAYKRDGTVSFLNSQLQKPAWTVDGVSVHEIDFLFSDELYSAYLKDSSRNVAVYLSTPNESETADLANSLRFIG